MYMFVNPPSVHLIELSIEKNYAKYFYLIISISILSSECLISCIVWKKKTLFLKFTSFISADKLQVTALKGVLGEEIDLVVRVQAFPKASKWLRTLENVMKNTLAMILQACVQTRVEEGKCTKLVKISKTSCVQYM